MGTFWVEATYCHSAVDSLFNLVKIAFPIFNLSTKSAQIL